MDDNHEREIQVPQDPRGDVLPPPENNIPPLAAGQDALPAPVGELEVLYFVCYYHFQHLASFFL